jgi:hypothetical protein
MLYISKLHGVNMHDGPLFKLAFNKFIANLSALNIVLEPNTMVNLDPAFDSKSNKKVCTDNNCIPNIKINPRNSKKQAVPPFPEIYKQRYVNERAFAWEDCFRRLVTRYEVKPQNHLAFCLMAAALTLLRLVRN